MVRGVPSVNLRDNERFEKTIIDGIVNRLGNLTNVQELARYLGVSESMVYEWIRKGLILVYIKPKTRKMIILTESIVNIFKN